MNLPSHYYLAIDHYIAAHPPPDRFVVLDTMAMAGGRGASFPKNQCPVNTSVWILLLVVPLAIFNTLQVQTLFYDNGPSRVLTVNDAIVHEASQARDRDGSIELEIPLRIEIIVGHCKEDLTYLDTFEACSHGATHLQFHIFSPCGGTIPSFTKITDCVTVHRSRDCGRETYSYFAYIVDRYDDLPDLMAFVQGSAITENPHIVEDVVNVLPTTTYMGLSRIVKDAWHMRADPKRADLQNRSIPSLQQQGAWPTSWRSQFMASRDAVRSVPRKYYLELMDIMCHVTCDHVQCALETWISPLMGCAEFLVKQEGHCRELNHENMSWAVRPADYEKDGNKGRRNDKSLVGSTKQVSCTSGIGGQHNQTIVYAKSVINGIFLCASDTRQDALEAWLRAKTQHPLPHNQSALLEDVS